jgi:hypothetical protein
MELDFVSDCPLQTVLDFADRHRLTLVSYRAHGPGGGNPALTFSGAQSDLDAARDEHFNHDNNPALIVGPQARLM